MGQKDTPSSDGRTHEQHAAIFIDFENLYERLQTYLDNRDRPEDIIIEMVEELRRYLQELNHMRTAAIYAYADFRSVDRAGERLKKELYLAGIEPRFVPEQLQSNAAELQLCVDASDMLHNRPQTQSFVILTGDRFYLPLVQQFKRFGCHTFVAAFSLPPSNHRTPRAEEDLFLDALHLVSEATRSRLAVDGVGDGAEMRDVEYVTIASADGRRTVEVIEEHFGQYDEVYLTPLLRKLSEVLGPQADPKAVINELEDAGAVWLEKRRGTPYDYTVLLVDYEHPDVQEIQQAHYNEDAFDAPVVTVASPDVPEADASASQDEPTVEVAVDGQVQIHEDGHS